MTKVALPKKYNNDDRTSEAPVKCHVLGCRTSTKYRTLKAHMLVKHEGYVVLFCTLGECSWTCFSSDLRCFVNHQTHTHQMIFKGKAHDLSPATGFTMGLVAHGVRKDKFGKVIHSEKCKTGSEGKTADNRLSSRFRSRVRSTLMPSVPVDPFSKRQFDLKGREYVQSELKDEWMEIFRLEVGGVWGEFTKKPEGVRKIQSGGRLKQAMFKQLPEGVGNKEDCASKVIPCELCERTFPKKKQLKEHLEDHKWAVLLTVKKTVVKRKRKLFRTEVSFLDSEPESEIEFNVSPVKKKQKLSD